MTKQLQIPNSLQYLIEKREAERRTTLDRRHRNGQGALPEAGERRSEGDRRDEDRRSE